MAKRSLAELTADPFLRSLEGRDDAQQLTIEQAAGFLSRSVTSLAEWRAAGKRPPGWTDDGIVRYPLGELRRYSREQLEATAVAIPPAPAPASPTAPTTAAEKVRQIAGKDAVRIFGFDDERLRAGQARGGVNQTSTAAFLSVGAPDDEWVFLNVPSPTPGNPLRRPVDLIATLDMDPDTLADATCQQMSLSAYAEALAAFLHAEVTAQRAEEAALRAARAGKLPPRDEDTPVRAPRPKA
ncbi:hypothetical protein ASG87_01700 [Frateuria sp. Soil773]|uniref:hypothetical protein n=1 Tax=Frateuria sp. Soil773 TaxID=1736407 RepID=UPI0006F20491|nr:hypothetical protein [Frateuria sp. Soil773]KRE90879.1 hypothetical protein ASG87_01700 [Frateuria sp. Soil773]